MSDDDEQLINQKTREIQQALLPALAGTRSEIAMPAMLQVLITMAMFVMEASPTEAIDHIIGTLEDAKRSRAN